MPAAKRKLPEMKTTIREFRAAPAKLLRRAARTGAKLRLGQFVLDVREELGAPLSARLYGAMATSGRLTGAASGLLSADDVWRTDG
jgi:hypothetical protein